MADKYQINLFLLPSPNVIYNVEKVELLFDFVFCDTHSFSGWTLALKLCWI